SLLVFVGASCLSILRQTGRLPVNVEVPSLVLWPGILSLAAHHRAVPVPDWGLISGPSGSDRRYHLYCPRQRVR
ncbi:MAG: hypothetical protein ACK5Q5_08775, partial [Planctomycetaceae bacterium]